MKDYYEILDVPLTATREQIKSQYRQLVRIHHPDRFRDASDKIEAEEKLKQINIAFQVLSGKSMHLARTDESQPLPVAYPPILDFGTVQPNSKSTLSLQVNNLGGEAKEVALRFNGDSGLFQISKGKRVYGDRAFPLNYAVSANTRRLAPETAHRGWLEIDLDGVTTQVELSLRIGTAPLRQLTGQRRFTLAKRWFLIVVIGLLFGALGASLPWLNPHLVAQWAPTTLFDRPFYDLDASELIFSVQEDAGPVLYAGDGAAQSLTGLGIQGQAAAGSAAGQQLAYLGDDGEVYLLDLQSGHQQPLTRSDEVKRSLAWSPDGTQLAYLLGSGNATRIAVHDLTLGSYAILPGAVTTKLIGVTGGVDHYRWSPVGNVILFDLWQGAERRVYRVGSDGTGLQQVTHFDSWGGSWSADGSQLVVSSPQGLYQLDAHGQALTLISEVAGELPSWSADGKWLAYLVRVAGGARQTLWLREMATGRTINVADEIVRYGWSPADDTLGYVTSHTTVELPLFYLWTLTPNGQPQLLAEVTDPFFDWSK